MLDCDFYFFDLYHTLVLLEPNPVREENEFAVLGISRAEWSRAAMGDYEARATGAVRDLEAIAASMIARTGVRADAEKTAKVVAARKERYRAAFSAVRPPVAAALSALRAAGKTLVLVSNADAFDSLYWEGSPLSAFFHAAVFSWEAGFMKPDRRIYELAMERAKAVPGRSVFVGDGGHDELVGAKAVGMRAVLTTELIAGLWPEEIPRLSRDADYVIGSLAELSAG